MEKEPTKTLEATARMARSADQPPGNLNEAPPIHRTPLELLLCIFKHILSFDCDEEEDAYYRELCTLSTVCARWYSIIRNSPRLWTKVPDSVKEDGLPMILEPSVGCIVDVVYKMEQYALGSLPSSHRLIRFLKRVESAAARWRSLTLSLYAYLYTSPVLHALRLPCPNLARLNLQDNECLTDISEVDIFSGSAPKLIDVRVLGITCQWSQAVFKELERLHLQLVEFSTVGTILDMLRDCPRLQKLEIVDCSTHFDLPVTATRRPVSLPDLQVLYVSFRRSRETDYQTPYSQMLDHIAVPSSCAFFTSFGREEEDDLVSICFQNWLFARQPRSVLEGVVSLEIRLGDLPNAVDFTLRSGSSTVEGGVTMWAPEEGTRMLGCIRDILHLSRASQLHTKLKIGREGTIFFRDSPFISQLGELPPITHLEVLDQSRSWYHGGLRDALTDRSSTTFSAIQDLTFRQIGSDLMNMVVQAVLGDAGTPTSSEAGERTLETIAIHDDYRDLSRTEAEVKKLREEARIGRVESYTT